MSGVVITTSSLFGEGIVTAWAMSNFGIQIVYGNTFVWPTVTSTPALKMP